MVQQVKKSLFIIVRQFPANSSYVWVCGKNSDDKGLRKNIKGKIVDIF